MSLLKTIKLKINSICMNSCRFCVFHNSKERLELADIRKILNVIPSTWRGQILINGGEPLLHANILQISHFLAQNFPNNRRGIGTNLRYFEICSIKKKKMFDKLVEYYDLFQIGCDDEHNNIDVVGKLVPIIMNFKKDVYINAITEFCNRKTAKRLLDLQMKTGCEVNFSPVFDHSNNHFSQNETKEIKSLCKKRNSDVLINSDGEIYKCFKQDFSISLGNIKNLEELDIKQILFVKDIDFPYFACNLCLHKS